ncbi:hypothetical protein QEH56_14640 [Pelagicoccus enzymogenes]|nr:hypothetical protein [Pelagicoccus enzymogenes]MDQ8199401.1 hypothetical protein [Pelagicoccus enzymogenes]
MKVAEAEVRRSGETLPDARDTIYFSDHDLVETTLRHLGIE